MENKITEILNALVTLYIERKKNYKAIQKN